MGPRADETHRAGARVGFDPNVLRFEVGDLFARVDLHGQKLEMGPLLPFNQNSSRNPQPF